MILGPVWFLEMPQGQAELQYPWSTREQESERKSLLRRIRKQCAGSSASTL
jgi:hypothetical protein